MCISGFHHVWITFSTFPDLSVMFSPMCMGSTMVILNMDHSSEFWRILIQFCSRGDHAERTPLLSQENSIFKMTRLVPATNHQTTVVSTTHTGRNATHSAQGDCPAQHSRLCFFPRKLRKPSKSLAYLSTQRPFSRPVHPPKLERYNLIIIFVILFVLYE